MTSDPLVMRGRRGAWIVLVAMLALSPITLPWDRAQAATATDDLRPAVDKVVRILAEPAMSGELRTHERRAALRAAMEGIIDFPEASRRALAMHWRARMPSERDEFTRLFTDLVIYSYIRLMEPYAGETVQFIGESEGTGVVTVMTRIVRRRGDPVPVDYRMHVTGAQWQVYDVVVEGVSLVANYRTQFNTIIQTSSYDELVRRMRARIAELSQAPAASMPGPRRG